jgi:hypothetical protein
MKFVKFPDVVTFPDGTKVPLLAPSQLERSCTVETVIVSYKDFRDYLAGLDSNKDLVNLARVVGWNASSC